MQSTLKIVAGIAVLLYLTGCSVYQHVVLDSNLPQNNNLGYQIENDSMAVAFSFHGENGPIRIELFNKSDKPFYVDWRKSALIINGQSTSLWKDQSRITGNSTEYKVYPKNEITNSTSTFEGVIEKKDQMTFVPPHSKVSVNSYSLQSKFFLNSAKTGERITLYGDDEWSCDARKFSFSRENTPLQFRIFLSFSSDGSSGNPVQLDSSFWVSEYIQTTASDKIINGSPENQFYIRKASGAGKVLLGVSLVGILVAGGAVAGGDAPSN